MGVEFLDRHPNKFIAGRLSAPRMNPVDDSLALINDPSPNRIASRIGMANVGGHGVTGYVPHHGPASRQRYRTHRSKALLDSHLIAKLLDRHLIFLHQLSHAWRRRRPIAVLGEVFATVSHPAAGITHLRHPRNELPRRFGFLGIAA